MKTIIRQALLLAAKDTKIFAKDRFAAAFSFLLPFAFIIGFSVALGGQGPRDEPLELVISTQESAGQSAYIVEEMAQSSGDTLRVMDYDAALIAVENGDLEGFVAFPADFTESLVSGSPTALEVVVTGDSPDIQAALSGFARSIAGEFSEAQIALTAISRLSGSDFSEVAAASMDQDVMRRGDTPVIRLEVESVGGIKPFNASNFTLPGYLTMFVFFAAAMSAATIARERQSHTLERLLSNGTRRESIVLGKFIAAATVGVIQIVVLWTVGLLAFRIDPGLSPAAVILISLLMALASASFAVMLASIVRDVQAASTAGVLASLVLAPLGGSWWPLFITPQWMQSLAKLTPHGWANGGFNKLMLFGAEFGDVTQEMAALAAFMVVFLAVAVWRFRLSAG